MFGTYLRGMAYVLITPVLAAIMGFVLDQMIGQMQAPGDSIVADAFRFTADHFLLIGLISIATLVAARAVVEGNLGGGI